MPGGIAINAAFVMGVAVRPRTPCGASITRTSDTPVRFSGPVIADSAHGALACAGHGITPRRTFLAADTATGDAQHSLTAPRGAEITGLYLKGRRRISQTVLASLSR
jgi:hypothetical protein